MESQTQPPDRLCGRTRFSERRDVAGELH